MLAMMTLMAMAKILMALKKKALVWFTAACAGYGYGVQRESEREQGPAMARRCTEK